MKTKFIYVIMAVLLMGSQMTLSAQNTASYTRTNGADAD